MSPRRIVSKPGLMGGVPCFEGTRIDVETIRNLVDGISFTVEDAAEDFPALTVEDIRAALAPSVHPHGPIPWSPSGSLSSPVSCKLCGGYLYCPGDEVAPGVLRWAHVPAAVSVRDQLAALLVDELGWNWPANIPQRIPSGIEICRDVADKILAVFTVEVKGE